MADTDYALIYEEFPGMYLASAEEGGVKSGGVGVSGHLCLVEELEVDTRRFKGCGHCRILK